MPERTDFEARLHALRESFGDARESGPAAAPAHLGSLVLAETRHASDGARALFRKAFRADIPIFPRHFELRPKAQTSHPIGYVHFTRAGPAYLGGGFAVSAMEFRGLDRATKDLVRAEGGLAEWMGRESCAALDGEAVFAYIGDTISIRVNTRLGFVFTGHRYLYALWKPGVAPPRRQELAKRVAAFGPF